MAEPPCKKKRISEEPGSGTDSSEQEECAPASGCPSLQASASATNPLGGAVYKDLSALDVVVKVRKGLGGNGIVHRIIVQSESKVEHLKQAIFRTLGVPEFAQKLLVNDMHLSSGEQLLSDALPSLLQKAEADREEDVTLLMLCSQEQAECLHHLEQMGPISPHHRDHIREDLHFWQRDMRRFPHMREEFIRMIEARHDYLRRYIPSEFFDDERFAWMVLQMQSTSSQSRLAAGPYLMVFMRHQLRQNREIAILAMEKDPAWACLLYPKLLEDREMLLIACRTSGLMLQEAPLVLQADKEVVLAAVQQAGEALDFASPALKANAEVVLVAVRQKGEALQFADFTMQSDRSVVELAVQVSPAAIQFASAALREDHKLVLMAVSGIGDMLTFAGLALQNDREIVAAAVQQTGTALQYASDGLRADWRIVALAVQKFGCALEHASAALQGDLDIVATAVQQSGTALRFASKELRANREMVLKALRQSPLALDFASPTIQADHELQVEAINVAFGPVIVAWAQEDITPKNCLELLVQFIVANGVPEGMSRLGAKLRSFLMKDPGIATAIVQRNPQNYRALDACVRGLKEVALAAVRHDWKILSEVPYQTRNDFDIQFAAVKQNRTALKYFLAVDRKRVSDAVEASQVEGLSDSQANERVLG